MQLAPFAHAQEAQEIPLAPVAQLRLGQVFVRLTIGLPQLEDADEFRTRVGELCMRVVGGFAGFGGTFARILDAEEGRDDGHVPQGSVAVRGHQHARQLHVHGQA